MPAPSTTRRLLRANPTLFGEAIKARPKAPLGGRVIQVADHFCGLGGSSSGAGLAISGAGDVMDLIAINHHPAAVFTHERNHISATHFCESIHAVPPAIAFPNSHVHLLMSSPSCKPHSDAASGRDFSDEERGLCWSVIPWLITNRVDYMVMENVRGFTRLGRNRDGSEFNAFLQAIRSLGYHVEWRILNCADFGVPQERHRLFVIASRFDEAIRWPAPTHGDAASGLRPWITTREILDFSDEGSLIAPDLQSGKIVPWTAERITEGRVQFHGEPFLVPRRMGGNTFVRSIDRPLMTVLTDPGTTLVHQVRGRWRYRKLTVGEYLRAMSFDDSYWLPADISQTLLLEMVGNAVPPKMMEAIVNALLYPSEGQVQRVA